MPSLGPSLPLSPPPCLLPPAGDGLVRRPLALLWDRSVLPLFWERRQCVGLASASFSPVTFLSLAIPQFKLLSHFSSLRLPSGHSGPSLPAPLCSAPTCWWRMRASGGTFLLGVVFRHVIGGFYLFFLPVRLPSEIQKLPPDPPVRGLPGVWKLPLLRLPSRDGSPSLTSFRRGWAAFLGTWCPLLAIRSCSVKFVQRSNVLSMNL